MKYRARYSSTGVPGTWYDEFDADSDKQAKEFCSAIAKEVEGLFSKYLEVDAHRLSILTHAPRRGRQPLNPERDLEIKALRKAIAYCRLISIEEIITETTRKL